MVKNQIIALVGIMGTAKTLYSTYLLSLKKKMNCEIWSNYDNQFADKISSAEELLLDAETRQIDEPNYKNIKLILALDELGALLRAGDWMSSKNEILSKIITMSRKLNIDIIYTTQHFSMIDRIIRRITTIYLDMDYDDETDIVTMDNFERNNEGLQYVETIEVEKLSRFFKSYNTYEIIEPNELAIILKLKRKVLLDKELYKRWYNATRLGDKTDILSFYLKVSKKVAKMVHLELSL